MESSTYLGHERNNGHKILIVTSWLLLKYSKCLLVVAVFRQKLQNVITQKICTGLQIHGWQPTGMVTSSRPNPNIIDEPPASKGWPAVDRMTT